jgi:hypothetical protein
MNHFCKNHPQTKALSFCKNCGLYFCQKCLNESKIYYYCNQIGCLEKYNEEIALPKDNVVITNHFERNIKNKRLIITKEKIQFGNKTISTNSLDGFFHCTVDITINLVQQVTHSIHFKDNRNNKIHIALDGIFSNKKSLFDEYNLVLKGIYKLVLPQYLLRLAQNIRIGEERKIGKCLLSRDGVYTLSGFPFYNKQDFIEYNDVIFYDKSGKILLASKKNKKVKAKIDMLKDWDSSIIRQLVDILSN